MSGIASTWVAWTADSSLALARLVGMTTGWEGSASLRFGGTGEAPVATWFVAGTADSSLAPRACRHDKDLGVAAAEIATGLMTLGTWVASAGSVNMKW
ncbi:MAG TPA: hypothetical protein VJP02_12620 [Candidatus Sulfotelmatobacter sp.]|nr:hypothetical protein [Candidatus Sulfotelmatobacter sp.]